MFEIFQRCILNLFNKQISYLGQCIFLTPCFNCQYWDFCFILDDCSPQECTMDPLLSQTEVHVWRSHCDFNYLRKNAKGKLERLKNIRELGGFLLCSFTQGVADHIHSVYKILSFKNN